MLVPLGMLAGAAMGEWVTSRRSGKSLLTLKGSSFWPLSWPSPPIGRRLLGWLGPIIKERGVAML